MCVVFTLFGRLGNTSVREGKAPCMDPPRWSERVSAELSVPRFRPIPWVHLLNAPEAHSLARLCRWLLRRYGCHPPVCVVCTQALARRRTEPQNYGSLRRMGVDVLRSVLSFLDTLPWHPALAGLCALWPQGRDYQCLPHWTPCGDAVTHLSVGVPPGRTAQWNRRWYHAYPRLRHLEVVGFCPFRMPKLALLQSLTFTALPSSADLGSRLAWCARGLPSLRRLHLRGLRPDAAAADHVLVPGVYTPTYPALEEVCLVMDAGDPEPGTHAWWALRYGSRPGRLFVDLPSVLYDAAFWNWCHYNHRLRLMAIRFRDVCPLGRFPDCLVEVDVLRVVHRDVAPDRRRVHVANLAGCLPRARTLVTDLPRGWASVGELVSCLAGKVVDGGSLVLSGLRVDTTESPSWAEVVQVLCGLTRTTTRTYLDLSLQTAATNQCPHCTSTEEANPRINRMFNQCLARHLTDGPVARTVHRVFHRGDVVINIRLFHTGCGRECAMTPTANDVVAGVLRQLWAWDHHTDV